MSIYETTGIRSTKYKKIETELSDFELLLQYEPQVLNGDKKDLKERNARYFLSGNLKEINKRSNSNLSFKSLIVLDYDTIMIPLVEFKRVVHEMLNPYNYILYPTISHEQKNPRYRLVIEPTRNFIRL